MKATWKLTGEAVALKNVDKASMESLGLEEQLINEINILHRLQHENVLRLLGCFEDFKTVYLVMELATDGSLFKKMDPQGRTEAFSSKVIPPDQVIEDVLRAVSCLHSQTPAIVHRDIKPENLLCFGNTVKLADFGSANTVDKVLKDTVCGTPEYLAPEMIKKEGHDEKIDLWCIGILLYELLYGHTPFSMGLQSFNTYDRDKLLEVQTDKILVANCDLE